jgi:hypothetical protein
MNPQPSKQFRWIGQPSEEELLGIPVSTRHHHRGVVRAAQAPPARRVVIAASPARRVRARDFLTVLGAGVIIWLVLGGAGAGFRSSGATPLAPEATDRTAHRVQVDRRELGSLPRMLPPSQEPGSRGQPGRRANDHGAKPGDKDKPAPPGGGGGNDPTDPPLVEATLPVVGTVTVDDPGVYPPDAPELPQVHDLPPVGDVLPETPTVPLP